MTLSVLLWWLATLFGSLTGAAAASELHAGWLAIVLSGLAGLIISGAVALPLHAAADAMLTRSIKLSYVPERRDMATFCGCLYGFLPALGLIAGPVASYWAVRWVW